MKFSLQFSMVNCICLLLVMHVVMVMSGFTSNTADSMPYKRTLSEILTPSQRILNMERQRSQKMHIDDVARFMCFDMSTAAFILQEKFDSDGDGYLTEEELTF